MSNTLRLVDASCCERNDRIWSVSETNITATIRIDERRHNYSSAQKNNLFLSVFWFHMDEQDSILFVVSFLLNSETKTTHRTHSNRHSTHSRPKLAARFASQLNPIICCEKNANCEFLLQRAKSPPQLLYQSLALSFWRTFGTLPPKHRIWNHSRRRSSSPFTFRTIQFLLFHFVVVVIAGTCSLIFH